jgi:hypothetical protein
MMEYWNNGRMEERRIQNTGGRSQLKSQEGWDKGTKYAEDCERITNNR